MPIRPIAATMVVGLALLGAAGAASAMSTQAAPVRAGGARLVDPDEKADGMADRTQAANARAYRQNDITNRNLVAPYGPAASFDTGPSAAPGFGPQH